MQKCALLPCRVYCRRNLFENKPQVENILKFILICTVATQTTYVQRLKTKLVRLAAQRTVYRVQMITNKCAE